ncbi:protein jag [Dissulfurirhabdus thermomarina]|uniref:RNA-binding protein KhpB n=1 Tax=Dissulfurirhabdus thermomarina TaxID=1765737 RepID=A0A6N9TQ07_DISTH|nr:RNA-binding cell elongation regulator Jag/EloR [Dissulfurirhabdus thermomarina]NDY43362.1 protein jag [Dissulfurirhabdus thermomarina]NMX23415.1 protein jag [Dissulfurirhabdus thermomarina]
MTDRLEPRSGEGREPPAEFEADTVDQAVAAAARSLGVAPEALEVEVLTRGSTGLFGIGGRKARILARVAAEAALHPAGTPAETAAGAAEAPGDLGGRVAGLCREILGRGGFEAEVAVTPDGSDLRVEISGPDVGLLIGRGGQTLDALEYLLNRLAGRGAETSARIRLDAGGYRERRARSLEALARRTAEKALRLRRPVSLPPMPPRERRIVHLALRDHREVRTWSSGEEPRRKVVVGPGRDRRPRHRRGDS